jgi:2-polyprenyl-3-methyl-5-hydroxy-6-metoxy-1,4-benzoquinol methylase
VREATVTVRDELQARALFDQRYGAALPPVARQIEQRVIGGDWGANGYTTMDQADTLAHELHLSAGDRLLDLGTGRGWPGLYLATRTGCQVVLTDLPLEGLRVAANRATREGLAARTAVVAAAASALPFQAGSFDAVIHTDVLC